MAMPYFFSMINPATVVMGALFLIFLALLSYILSKVFRDKYGNVSTVTVGVISFCISVLIVYFGRDTIYNIIDSLRLSNTILYLIAGAAVLFLLYFFRKKLRLYLILMIIGAGLILTGGFTEWFYQKGFVIILGIILFLLGIWLCSRKPKTPNLLAEALGSSSESYGGGRRQERKTVERNARELRKKYRYYSRLIKSIQKKHKGKIPKLGTPEGDLRHRYIQAMKAIENMAKKQGIKL